METQTPNIESQVPQVMPKKNWFSKHKVLMYVYLALIFLVILFLFKGFIVRAIYKDSSGKLGELMGAFIRKSDSDTAQIIRFPQGTIRLVLISGQQEMFYKKTGEEAEKKLSIPSDTRSAVNDGASVYVAYPYLFQVRYSNSYSGIGLDTKVMIYDLEANTYEYTDLDNCNGVITTGVAYDAGKIYWHQAKEWSSCTGSYKKSYKLDKPIVDSTNLPVPPAYKTVTYENTKYGYEFTYPETAVVKVDKEFSNGSKVSQQNITISLADNADFSVNIFINGESDFYLHKLENVKTEHECYNNPLGGKPAWQCNNPRSSPPGLPINGSYHLVFTDRYIYQVEFREDDYRRPDYADLMDKVNKIFRSFKIK